MATRFFGAHGSFATRMLPRLLFGLVLACIVGERPAVAAPGVELRPATNAAFDRYVALTDQRNNKELKTGQHICFGLTRYRRATARKRMPT